MLTQSEDLLKKFFMKKTRKYADNIARKKTFNSRNSIVCTVCSWNNEYFEGTVCSVRRRIKKRESITVHEAATMRIILSLYRLITEKPVDIGRIGFIVL